MKKTLLLSLVTATLLSTNANAENMYDRIQAMEAQMKSLKQEILTLQIEKEKENKDIVSIDEALSEEDEEEEDSEEENSEEEEIPIEESIADLEESIEELNRATSGNHLKFSVDYRFGIDNIQYTMADKSEAKNDALLTNRLWVNMFFKATDNLSFRGQVAYNKAFGARSGTQSPTDPAYNAYEDFDWISNENAYDGTLRVKSAYFFYKNDTFIGTEIPWTFSVGRRPSTNGHLINYRDDDHASSPLAHTINVEFDGLSSKFTLADSIGMSLKLCAGRGLTNANVKFTSTPYANDEADLPDIDLAGLIFVPYSDGQYSVNSQYYYAANLIDMADPMASDKSKGFDTVGSLHSFTANLTVSGIGNELSDFLDETTFFVSGAWTKTDPKKGQGMLGSAVDESVEGHSYWVGTQFPSFTEDGRFGLEFNHGSQYFRSITYAEDTNVGSKLATRGNAYEAYMTEYLIEDILSFQIRYTYIDYEYTGSNGFFGNSSGNSMKISDIQAGADAGNPQMIGMASQVVDNAQDIRFYLRYKY